MKQRRQPSSARPFLFSEIAFDAPKLNSKVLDPGAKSWSVAVLGRLKDAAEPKVVP